MDIFIIFNSRTTHQTSQSQAMQAWTHLRPRSPLHTPLDLLNALHLNHGHSRASPALWYAGEEKGEGNYFTCYGRNLINNWIFSMKAKTKCYVASLFVCLFFAFIYLRVNFASFHPSCQLQMNPSHLPIHF